MAINNVFEIIDIITLSAMRNQSEIANGIRQAGYSGNGKIFVLYPPYLVNSEHELSFYKLQNIDKTGEHEYDSYTIGAGNVIGLYFEPGNEPAWATHKAKVRFISKTAQQGDAPEPASPAR
jgi:hypothetical protein